MIAAATGFLIAVLWFDLMFDVQVIAHHRATDVPESVLESISRYYHRVTTTASPMGRLVAVVMLVLLGALITQAARDDAPRWVSAVSLSAAVIAITLTVARVLRNAQRLGAQMDALDVRSHLARGILRDHLACLALMVTLLAVQLIAA